ncbi:MarR family winged helix-turn-helix transcriptional regulator [Jidongwangia harbinensis]|uniref:MarR family winged helix-turn-helix transcriptional regulator n=1 Tax=Jidongwangia harbinensis TaxID=2878561 RepID=UPI001CD9F3FE|nr:MarR family transcriptional regulator [Jidongwangia harbinensis]MCA2217820.1 MarR family transcriptional regulator [Jidongwangia harbinensis]
MPRRPARSQPVASAPPDVQPAAGLLKDDFAWALGVILRRYLRAVDDIISDIPGGPRGWLVVANASQDLAANQVVMAAQLGIDRSVLTYLIDDLETAGLVARQLDPADRRNRRVVATDAGLALWKERREKMLRVEDEILATLGDRGPEFKELLQRVAVFADRLDPTRNPCEAVTGLTDDPTC